MSKSVIENIILCPDKAIGPTAPCFVICEIGQNHQGDLNIAKEMIKAAKLSGADCVKFQKSDLSAKFNKNALERPYMSVHSWGKTYGDHKRHLEFSENEYRELQTFSKSQNILFTASAMDEISLDFLLSLNVPFIKLGSGDSNNLKLINKAASSGVPLVVSTGMCDLKQVNKIYETIKKHHKNFSLLHCVSSYPTPEKELNLNVIKTYQTLYPDVTIGYSGHEFGFRPTLVAVSLGAKVIERHFTLDKTWKGSDHCCSLSPEEFKKMVQEIRALEKNDLKFQLITSDMKLLGNGVKTFQMSEKPCYEKLGKSLVSTKDLKVGHVLLEDDICIKVAEPNGISAQFYESTIGMIVSRNILNDESITYDDVSSPFFFL